MSKKRIRELEEKLKNGFRDKLPCIPEFFSWHCDSLDLKTLDQKALALEVNAFLFASVKKGEFVRADVPFTLASKIAGREIRVKVLSEPIRKMQQELERLMKQSVFPGPSMN